MSNKRMVLNETSYFGKGSREVLADEIKKRGFKKGLVVTDRALYEVKVTEKVTKLLDEANIDYEVYYDVKPNPTIENVHNGLDACKKANADFIIAVGGGSAIDTSKAISIITTNPDFYDVVSLDGVANTPNKGLPLIALPTTSGTAAEVTINYVITDPKAVKKMVCVDPHDIPILAIVDSELMASMPKGLAAATGMDALTHSVEGYITKAGWELTDTLHMKAMTIIYHNLAKAVNEKDEKAIEEMALGQYIAGMGFSNVGLGIVHSMAHQLGAVYDTPHGVANAVLLPHVMRYNGEVCEQKFREMLKAFDTDTTNMSKKEVIDTFVDKLTKLSIEVGIPKSLRELNVKKEDIKMLSEKAMKDVCTPGNPRTPSAEDIAKIFEEAF